MIDEEKLSIKYGNNKRDVIDINSHLRDVEISTVPENGKFYNVAGKKPSYLIYFDGEKLIDSENTILEKKTKGLIEVKEPEKLKQELYSNSRRDIHVIAHSNRILR